MILFPDISTRVACSLKNPPCHRRFTFIEVLVALAILGISLAILLQILATARARMLRAEERWSRQHVVEQATEFYLLAGPDSVIPSDFLPENYSVEVRQFDEWEGKPETFRDSLGGWVLRKVQIRVFDHAGRPLGEESLEIFAREGDL